MNSQQCSKNTAISEKSSKKGKENGTSNPKFIEHRTQKTVRLSGVLSSSAQMLGDLDL